MPRPKPHPTQETFGQRLARLRKARGLSQRDLSRETGVSQRMIAYYETQAQGLPSGVLPLFAQALAVSIDKLVGVERPPQTLPLEGDVRIWRRLKRIESLRPTPKKTVLRLLDSLLDQYGTKSTDDNADKPDQKRRATGS